MNEPELPAASAAAGTSSAVKSAEARLTARGKPSRDSPSIKAAKCAGTTTRLEMWRLKSVLRSYKSMLRSCSAKARISTRAAPLKAASTTKSTTTIEV